MSTTHHALHRVAPSWGYAIRSTMHAGGSGMTAYAAYGCRADVAGVPVWKGEKGASGMRRS